MTREAAFVVERVQPPMPPPLFRISFSHSDGLALVAALAEYADRHPRASGAEKWRGWAEAIDAELRRER